MNLDWPTAFQAEGEWQTQPTLTASGLSSVFYVFLCAECLSIEVYNADCGFPETFFPLLPVH